MTRSAHKLLRSQAGFSFAELLVTLTVLVLVSAIVAAGVPSAYRAYINTVDAANAHLLLATTSTRLRDVLSVADPDTIEFASGAGETGSDAEDSSSDVQTADESGESQAGVESSLQRDETLVTFESLETGYTTEIFVRAEDQAICVRETNPMVATGSDSPVNPKVTMLVPEKAAVGAGSPLSISIGKITYDSGIFEVTELEVKRRGESFANAKVDKLEIRVLAAMAAAPGNS